MAETIEIHTLRRVLQDWTGENGVMLAESAHAFADDELSDLYDNAIIEVSDGAATASTATPIYRSLAFTVARADGLLMLAQDTARRHKWSINNKVVDEDNISEKLVSIARELRLRYTEHQRRALTRDIENLESPDITPGGTVVFNSTAAQTSARNFNNRDVKRNTPKY